MITCWNCTNTVPWLKAPTHKLKKSRLMRFKHAQGVRVGYPSMGPLTALMCDVVKIGGRADKVRPTFAYVRSGRKAYPQLPVGLRVLKSTDARATSHFRAIISRPETISRPAEHSGASQSHHTRPEQTQRLAPPLKTRERVKKRSLTLPCACVPYGPMGIISGRDSYRVCAVETSTVNPNATTHARQLGQISHTLDTRPGNYQARMSPFLCRAAFRCLYEPPRKRAD